MIKEGILNTGTEERTERAKIWANSGDFPFLLEFAK